VAVNPTQVSYRGMPPLMLDLLAGRVDYVCQQANGIIGQLDAIKVYAVADDRRASLLPGVPTTTEAGLPQFKSTVWLGLAAPKGTPQSVIQTVNRALAVAFDDPEVQKRYADLGLDIPIPEQRSPEWFRTFMRSEMQRWTDILRKAGVKPEQ
jgi:tripartite-type tricarboxylate transporter receptor subunit TctC